MTSEVRVKPSLVLGVVRRPLVAILTRGPAIQRLLERLHETPDTWSRMRVCQTSASVTLIGPEADLPWIDGGVYLAAACPGLWLPATETLDLDPDLVRRAILHHHTITPPIILEPRSGRLTSAGDHRSLSLEVLEHLRSTQVPS